MVVDGRASAASVATATLTNVAVSWRTHANVTGDMALN
jgi:hypothetical protein